MPLTTLQRVKDILAIPSSDTSEDAAVQAALNAAEGIILEATGYVVTTNNFIDYIEQPQVGRTYLTKHRPITNVSAEVRLQGDENWTSIAIDVLDAERGIILIPGNTVFPPSREPVWFRWRLFNWDVAKITYTANALSPVPESLSHATALYAAWLYLRSRAVHASRATAGQVTEEFREAFPSEIHALLAPYLRELRAWV